MQLSTDIHTGTLPIQLSGFLPTNSSGSLPTISSGSLLTNLSGSLPNKFLTHSVDTNGSLPSSLLNIGHVNGSYSLGEWNLMGFKSLKNPYNTVFKQQMLQLYIMIFTSLIVSVGFLAPGEIHWPYILSKVASTFANVITCVLYLETVVRITKKTMICK